MNRLHACLDILHWSHLDLADECSVAERTAARWFAGTMEVPGPVMEWLELLAAFHAAHPAPGRK